MVQMQQLSLNINKTNFVHFKLSNTNTNDLPNNILIDGVPLERKTHTKFLGVFIDEHLNWN